MFDSSRDGTNHRGRDERSFMENAPRRINLGRYIQPGAEYFDSVLFFAIKNLAPIALGNSPLRIVWKAGKYRHPMPATREVLASPGSERSYTGLVGPVIYT